jgi:very-short-patch-repair endonuclease
MKLYDEANTGAVLRARQLRREATDAEKLLWRALRSKLSAYKWRRQMPVGPYFADFACFAEKLIVEIDGGQHADCAPYDERRTRFIEAHGYRVLRFWNNDLMTNGDGVLERILESLSQGGKKEQRELRNGKDVQSASPSQPAVGPLPLPAGEV